MVTTHSVKRQLILAMILLSVFLTFLYAISNMSIAQTYTFYLTQPFILAIMAHFLLKERIGIHRAISIILGFCGVLIVLRPGALPIEWAALSALLCAGLFATANMTIKFMDQRNSWMNYVFYVKLVQLPLLGGYLLFSGGFEDGFWPSYEALPWIITAGICYCCALGLFPMAIQRTDAAVFGALEYTILFWGVLFGFILFSEIPDRWTIAGAVVIVASGLYLVYRERKAHLNITKHES